jgi:hypothetical protein
MAWMVSLILILFWWLGAHVFHEKTFSPVLPYVAISFLVIDFLLARLFRRKPSNR